MGKEEHQNETLKNTFLINTTFKKSIKINQDSQILLRIKNNEIWLLIREESFFILPRVDLAGYKKVNHLDFSYLECNIQIKYFSKPKSINYNYADLYSCSM